MLKYEYWVTVRHLCPKLFNKATQNKLILILFKRTFAFELDHKKF